MTGTIEIWRDVVGYEGQYLISSLGRIKGIDRIARRGNFSVRVPGLIKKVSINNRGYYSITLCKDARYRHFVIHKLVAQAFIPNPENKEYINHKDGNKLNNNINNLEWCTVSENNQHAYDIGLKVGAALGKFGADNPSSKPVLLIARDNKIIEFAGIHEAARATGLNASSICAALRGRAESCGGYKWEYKNIAV